MTIYQKCGSALLSAVLLVTMIGVVLTAGVAAAATPTLSAENKTVAVGDTFDVAIQLDNAEGVCGGNFTLQYDSDLLTVDSHAYGALLGEYTKNVNLDYQSAGNLIRLTFSGATPLAVDGTLVTLTFTAKASGTAALDFTAYKLYDENGSGVTAAANSGSVAVEGEVLITAPLLSAENKTVTAGDTFDVAIELHNAAGICGGNFTLQYDSDLLTVDGYAYGALLGEYTKNVNLDYQSAGNLIRLTFSGATPLAADGTLVTLTFTAKENVDDVALLAFTAYKMYDKNGSALDVSASGSTVGINTSSDVTTTTATTTTTAAAPTTTTTAAAITDPHLSAGSVSVTVGESFEVAVQLDNAEGVCGGNFTLQYDSELLTVDGYAYGEFLGEYTKNINLDYQSAGNLIRLTFSGATPLTADGTLVILTFTAKASGTAALDFTACKAYDENGSSLAAVATNDVVTITDDAPIITTSTTVTSTTVTTTTTVTQPSAADGTVVLSAQTITCEPIKAGDTFELAFSISKADGFGVMEAYFAYDNSKIRAISGEAKGVLAQWEHNTVNLDPATSLLGDDAVGEIWITGMSTDGDYATNGEVIAVVTFEAVVDMAEDTAVYGIGTPMILSAAGEECPVVYADGGIVVNATVTTSTTTTTTTTAAAPVKGDGDTDGNGTVNIRDAVQCYYHVNGKIILDAESQDRADVSDPIGSLTIRDAVTIYYFVNGKTSGL